MLKVSGTDLDNLSVISTQTLADKRGQFTRLFCQEELRKLLADRDIKQVNHSSTVQAGSVRGMHFQYPPKAEGKFVRCIRGRVFDVAIDIRRNSKTFLQWYGCELSDRNRTMIFIPEGFAHGFQTLGDNCEMLYLHTEFYSASHEGAIRFDDPKVNIEWPLEMTHASDRDRQHPFLAADFNGIEI